MWQFSKQTFPLQFLVLEEIPGFEKIPTGCFPFIRGNLLRVTCWTGLGFLQPIVSREQSLACAGPLCATGRWGWAGGAAPADNHTAWKRQRRGKGLSATSHLATGQCNHTVHDTCSSPVCVRGAGFDASAGMGLGLR